MTPSESSTPALAADDLALAVASFSDFGLHPSICKAIDEQGYTTPTPIQAQAIPVVLAGVDVMGAAQTGTGKTASFSLPILNRLMPLASDSTSPARHPVRALILTPTRELADQVAANVKVYAAHTPLRSTVVYGGMDMNPQVQALRRGVELVIATPGRLLDHVQQKSINLSQVQMLVLDEADRMLDMGFLPDLQRIINLLPDSRQNLMFSATFSPEIRKLANSFMKSPTLIEVARRNATSENVQQCLFTLDSQDDKRAAVCHLIRTRNLHQVIVFCNTKLGTARLTGFLEKEGLAATAIHGDKSQIERMKSLEAFKAGEVAVLVATDVAARGLDIADLPCVINYDLPTTPEDYVHRIGRTGRAGASGTAWSFMAKGDERLLKDIEKLIGKSLEPQVLEGFVPPSVRFGNSADSSSRERFSKDLGGRTPRRGEASVSRESKESVGRPRRGPDYGRRAFDEDGPIHRDAEFERLRVQLARMQVADDVFHRPYQEKVVNAEVQSASLGNASGQSSLLASRSGKRNSALAVLLGGAGSRR